MSDEKNQLDRIENTLAQLIDIIGKTNASVSDLRSAVSDLQKGQAILEAGQNEIKDTVFRIEHRLNVMERKQGKMSLRLDTVEAEVELLQDTNQ